MGENPGLVVMGGDTLLRGREFESLRLKPYEAFFTFSNCCTIVDLSFEEWKGRGLAIFKKRPGAGGPLKKFSVGFRLQIFFLKFWLVKNCVANQKA